MWVAAQVTPAATAAALEEIALGLVGVGLPVEVGRARVPPAPMLSGERVQLGECCCHASRWQHYRTYYSGCRVGAPALEEPPVRRAWLCSLDRTQQARHRHVWRLPVAADARARTPAVRHPLAHRKVDRLSDVEALVEAEVEGRGEHEDERALGLARRADRDAVRAEGGGRYERRLARVRVKVEW